SPYRHGRLRGHPVVCGFEHHGAAWPCLLRAIREQHRGDKLDHSDEFHLHRSWLLLSRSPNAGRPTSFLPCRRRTLSVRERNPKMSTRVSGQRVLAVILCVPRPAFSFPSHHYIANGFETHH